MLGELVGNYRIVAELGAGGMGVVYRAEHTLLARPAAIKLLLPELSRNTEIVARFFNEAKAATSVGHAGIVDVFDFGYHAGGSAYIAMELLRGETLSTRLREQRPLPIEVALVIARQLTNVLAAAHARGIVHRDLKPDNVFLVPDPDVVGGLRVKVLDFGIAKLAGDARGASVKTLAGSVMGTPVYMSPEQCRDAGEVDARADVYSLGCILFEMLCGQPPFSGQSAIDLIVAHLRETPPRPRSLAPGLPLDLEAVILQALEKRPGDRPESMHSFGRQLGRATPSAHPAPAFAQPSAGAASPRMSTTLGGAAAQVEPGAQAWPRGRHWLGLLGTGLAVVVALGLLWTRPRSAPRMAAAKAPSYTAVAPPAQRTAPVQPAAPPPGATAPTISLVVDSRPHGAEVFRVADGVLVGRTPLQLAVTPGVGQAQFILRLAGHRDARATLPIDRASQVTIDLTALRLRSPTTRPSVARATPAARVAPSPEPRRPPLLGDEPPPLSD